MSRALMIFAASACWCVPGAVCAQQVAGPRAAAMGEAHRGVASSNDTIFLNPAGISLYPRMSLELFWKRNTGRNANQFSMSLLDSKTGPVGGALAYTYEWVGTGGSVRAGSRVDIASSYQLASFLLFGMTVHYHGMSTAEGKVNRVSGDTGFLFLIGNFLTIGLTGHNVISPVEETAAAPRMFGGGFALTLFKVLQLAFDYRKSVEREGRPSSYFMGAEYFFWSAFAARGGFVIDEFLEERRWSAGLGYLNPTVGLDVAYSRTIRREDRVQYISLGLRFFL